MNSRFILPASVATALHTLVLFGVGGGEPVSRVKDDPSTNAVTSLVPFVIREIEPPPVEDTAEESTALRRGELDTLRPTLEESLAKPAFFEMPRIETRAVEVHPDKIVPGSWGSPDGLTDVGADPGAILNVGLLDHQPGMRSRTPPVYPAEARRRGLSGEVLVEFVVNEEGRVLSPRVVRSSDPVFDAATLRAVERWRFEPGRKNGKPVSFRMTAPVVFTLAE